MTETLANLIDDRDVTALFIADPLSWRVRVVEELVVDAATSCTRRRSLQVAPLRTFLDQYVTAEHQEALVAMNVAPMRRGPLLDFDVTGPHGEGALLIRDEIATRECAYLQLACARAGVKMSSNAERVLVAVLGFAGGHLGGKRFSLESYLDEGVGEHVDAAVVNHLVKLNERAQRILGPRAGGVDRESAPQNPALVVPSLVVGSHRVDASLALDWVSEYVELLEDLASKALEENAAHEFLDALADYGQAFDLIVALRVPLDEPFSIKFSERRRLGLNWRNVGDQELVVADAASNHVTFKVTDPNVRIRSVRAFKPQERTFAEGDYIGLRDDQTWTVYAPDPDRDYRIRLEFKLGLLRRLQVVQYLVALILCLLAASLLIDRPHDLRTLALVAGPSALGAGVLLAREPTTLGSRLRLMSSLIVAAGMVAVVGVATWLFVEGAHRSSEYDEDTGGSHGEEHGQWVPARCSDGAHSTADFLRHLGQAQQFYRTVCFRKEVRWELQGRP